ncbi:MAG: flavin reductase family protein [Paracoccaceae bacterium]|nr:flavin reductase family protein [Paracoccaceae bacterium]
MTAPAADNAAIAPVSDARFEPRAFRNALGQFPTGVCVVTAQAPDGEDLGMTMSSFNSLSLDPPLILFSIDRRALSLSQWKQAKGYAVNFLAESQKHISDKFARSLSDKWSGVVFDRGEAKAPLLRGATAQLECSRHTVYEVGDHVLFIARVKRFRSFADRMPLIFCNGKYGSLRSTDELLPFWPLAVHY